MKTNTNIERPWTIEDVMVKPFVFDGDNCWEDDIPTKPSHGVLRLFPETMEIEVEILRGCRPLAGDLLNFLLNDKDVKYLIRKYQQKGRVKPFVVVHTSSQYGTEDYYIQFPDEYGLIVSQKHLLHISCFAKIEKIKRMYIGDFAEVVAEYLGYTNYPLVKSTCRYEQPCFIANREDIKVSPTKLL